MPRTVGKGGASGHGSAIVDAIGLRLTSTKGSKVMHGSIIEEGVRRKIGKCGVTGYGSAVVNGIANRKVSSEGSDIMHGSIINVGVRRKVGKKCGASGHNSAIVDAI